MAEADRARSDREDSDGGQEDEGRDESRERGEAGDEGSEHRGGGLGATIVNNMPAFGFSLLATGSFGVISHYRGSPGIGGVVLFTTGAILAFAATEAGLTRGFRRSVGEEPERVVALGTTFSFISVGLAVIAAGLVGKYLHAQIAWGAGACAAALTYIVLSGIEMSLAERIERRRDDDAG